MRKIKILLLTLLLSIPFLPAYSQPGCGLTCINISKWRPAGKMVKVEIWGKSSRYKVYFKISKTDSILSLSHSLATMNCKLTCGGKVIKIRMDSLDCNKYYNFSIPQTKWKHINLVPSGKQNQMGCSNRNSILLIWRQKI